MEDGFSVVEKKCENLPFCDKLKLCMRYDYELLSAKYNKTKYKNSIYSLSNLVFTVCIYKI